jgi:hypothetical protein
MRMRKLLRRRNQETAPRALRTQSLARRFHKLGLGSFQEALYDRGLSIAGRWFINADIDKQRADNKNVDFA